MRPIMSAKLTPLAATRMRTSPAAGAGSGACFICRTSGPPALVIQICFMGVFLDVASGAKCLPRAPSPLRLALRRTATTGPASSAMRCHFAASFSQLALCS